MIYLKDLQFDYVKAKYLCNCCFSVNFQLNFKLQAQNNSINNIINYELFQVKVGNGNKNVIKKMSINFDKSGFF